MSATDSYQHVALLGSSYAAGPDIAPVIDTAAGRSANNYGEIVARRLGAKITDLAVSGATTQNLLATAQRAGAKRFAPQVPQLPPEAELIMVTAGGNDLGYLQSIIPAVLAGRLDERVITRPLAAAARLIFGTPRGKDVEVAATGLTGVVEAARQRAAGARVVLVGYPMLFGPDDEAAAGQHLRRSDLDAIRDIGRRLDRAYELAADRTGAELVRTAELGRDHAVGSTEPWVNGVQGVPGDGSALHPNAAGHRAMAEAVLALL